MNIARDYGNHGVIVDIELCGHCNGTGMITVALSVETSEKGRIHNLETQRCPACEGTGRMTGRRIPINPSAEVGSARFFNCSWTASSTLSTPQILSEKEQQCLRIARIILPKTTVTPDLKIETLANLLIKLPDDDIKTIRNLLEDFTVEQVPQPKQPLNRFQILKKKE